MGICDCGKPTVWDDLCEECLSEYENEIFYGQKIKREIGQLFTRRIDDGRFMVVGIISSKDLPEECVIPVEVMFEVDNKEDRMDLARGKNLGNMLKEPIWRVSKKE
jgi:hypothetical protein